MTQFDGTIKDLLTQGWVCGGCGEQTRISHFVRRKGQSTRFEDLVHVSKEEALKKFRSEPLHYASRRKAMQS